jgi:hypothetical protein
MRLIIYVSIPPRSLRLPQLYAYQSDCIQNLLTWILEKEEGLFSLLVVPWAGYKSSDFEN